MAEETGSVQTAEAPLSRGKVLLSLGLVLVVCLAPFCVWWLFLQWRAPNAGKALYEIGLILCIVCPILAARYWPKWAGFEIRWLPLRKRDWLWGLLLLVVMIAWMSLSVRLIRWAGWNWWRAGFLHGQRGPVLITLYLLSTVLLVPVAEEFLFRGYVQEQFAKVTKGYLAVAAQAVLFALLHAPGHAAYSLYILGFGLIVGFWRLRKRSLLPLVIVHVLINAIAAVPPYVTEMSFYRAAQSPPEVGVPVLAEYFEREDASRYQAADVMLKVYGASGSKQYAEILRTGSDRQVEQILVVIDCCRCKELIPDMRRVVYSSRPATIQIAAAISLQQLGDVEGLTEIARDHPDEKVRKAAASMLRHKSRTQGESPPAPKDSPVP